MKFHNAFFPAIICFTLVPCAYSQFIFQHGFYEVPIDHFSFASNKTFQMKYLYNDTHWNKSQNGPIFFYTGNEGTIELFAQNTGFMWDIAEEFGALLLFAEHRYYGDSMPFGGQSFSSPEKTGYLTSEQALADFAQFLVWYKLKTKSINSPVIAFGGSYGGMLTAWMRIKYPHIIQGGIAGSAPILQFSGMTPCVKYGQIVTADFDKESPNCSNTIRKSWEVINQIGKTIVGRTWLTKKWNLCKPLTTWNDVMDLKNWLVNSYGYLAMANYPYSTNFIAPLPGNPVKAVCQKMEDTILIDKDLLKSIFKGITIYFNYTGTAICLDVNQEASQSLGTLGWDYQACTEMVMPMCNDGVRDFFEVTEWNLTQYEIACENKWKVKPRPFMAEWVYGGRDIKASSNIVFSNGLLDPWYGGGVLTNLSSSLLAIIIPEGAHHLDLRSAHPDDPPSVIHAREFEKTQIRKWIREYYDEREEYRIENNLID